jgi:diguanylate cyclase (GGDEF)-like protein/PAS domain S-box-containing protein
MIGRMAQHLRIILLFILALAMGYGHAAESVSIGILGFRPAAEEQRRWQPLIDYLNSRTPGYRFRAEVLGYGDLEAAIAQRQVSFVLTNPGHYVLMTHRNGMSSPLATLVPIENGQAVSHFGGVMFTRAEHVVLQNLTDLRGHTIAAASRGSLGGYQAQAMTLLKVGVRIPQDARLIETDMPHDNVVAAVLDGRADAGFVRAGVLEAMAREGNLDLSRLRVLNARVVSGFPFMLSTDLYPEWPFAVMPNIDGDLARQVAAALLSLPHDGELARHMRIRGFSIPADYEPVRTTLEALRLPPFDATPHFTVLDIWQTYRWEAVITISLILIIMALGGLLVVLNRRLNHNAHEWQGLLTALGDGVFGVDTDGRCTFINPAALAMLGFSQDDVIGRDVHDLFHPRHEDGAPYPKEHCPVLKTLEDGQVRHAEDCFLSKDGAILPVAVTATPLGANTNRRGVVAVFRDVSDHRRLESELREEAATDALTGLPNRRYFLAELERHWTRVVHNEGCGAAVMMLDLDHFKEVNDTYGHATGDEVLKHLAALIRAVLRKGDLVGRLGGEEFAVLQLGASQDDALQLAQRIRQSIQDSVVPTRGGGLHYTASIGVTALAATDRNGLAVLLRADAALYRAKNGGRNRVEWEPPTPAV